MLSIAMKKSLTNAIIVGATIAGLAAIVLVILFARKGQVYSNSVSDGGMAALNKLIAGGK